MLRKRKTRAPAQRWKAEYLQLWRVVDGAVADAFNKHPNYLAPGKREKTVRESINKRVVGALIGFRKEESIRQKVVGG